MATKSYCVTLLVTGYTTLHVEAENKEAAVKAAEKSFYDNCSLCLNDAETDTWEIEEE